MLSVLKSEPQLGKLTIQQDLQWVGWWFKGLEGTFDLFTNALLENID